MGDATTPGRASRVPPGVRTRLQPVRLAAYRAREQLRAALTPLAWSVLWPRTEPVPHRVAPGHYYSPVPSIADVDAWAPSPADPASGIAGIDLRVDAQAAFLASLAVTLPTGPRFAENEFFDTGDAAIYQAILRLRDPRRVVEVGAGWSTAALFDAAVAPAVTVIDPDPSRALARLHPEDLARCHVRAERLQDVELAPFLALEPGDILFVDSTHVSKLGSDVNRLVFEILPRLQPGVAVHFHDVAFPFEYPQAWFRDGRYWNEAYLLRAFLQYSDTFEIMLWADLLRRLGRVEDPALAGALARQHSAGIWIHKRPGPAA